MKHPFAARVAGIILLVLGLLPVANWIPGGHEAPWYAERLSDWSSSGLLVVGIAVLSGMSFNRYPALWKEGLWQRIAERWYRSGRRGDFAVALFVTAICAVFAQTLYSAKPLLIDEVIQVFQARIFASGRLWLPAGDHPAFTSAMHLLDWNGKVYGQFPAGGPAIIAIGTLLHAEWLVGPVAAGCGVFFLARLLRRIEVGRGIAFAALILYAIAPFVVFLGGSYMNHVTTTAALLGAAWALAVATGDEVAHPLAAFWCGLALGIAATIRPMDGAVFALPTGIWFLWRAKRGGKDIAALLASGVGVALPLVVLFIVNAGQTGDPFRFGYIEMWGKTHELGFHEAPWGPPHTPARGIELINLYLLRLQSWLFEAPVPSLLFATGALLLVRKITAFDRWILASSAGLLLAYFAYWHDGFYLGPRFMLPLAPWLVLWTARLPSALASRSLPLALQRGVLVGGVTAVVLGLAVFAPIRATQYRNGMTSMRIDIEGLAASRGVSNALIFVRESWGGQLMTRLWAMGVTRSRAEQLYRTTDACDLEEAISEVEVSGSGVTGLEALMAKSPSRNAPLGHLTQSPDSTLRVRRGAVFTPKCLRRLAEDQAGFTLYPPMLLAQGSNQYVMDLHAMDSLMMNQLPGRAVWLLMKPPTVGAAPQLLKVSLDSARADWRREY